MPAFRTSGLKFTVHKFCLLSQQVAGLFAKVKKEKAKHEFGASLTHPDQALAGNLHYLNKRIYFIYLAPITKQH